MEKLDEIWQTSVNGQIYETDFSGLVAWIAEGSLQPQDKVRKGNLQWTEADNVPALHRFFNAMQLESANQIVTSINAQNSVSLPQAQNFNVNSTQPVIQNFQTPPPPTFYNDLTPETESNFCVVHTYASAKYQCEKCESYFCKACPKDGICPMCRSTCKDIEVQIEPQAILPQVNATETVSIDEDIKRNSYWFHWKAGFTLINSILILAGIDWQFFIGLTIPQFLHGFLIGITELEPDANLVPFHLVVFLVALIGSGLTSFFGYKAGQGKKWAFILGIVIFAFDGILYLLTLSVFGILIHGYAIYLLSKGYSGCNNK